MASKMVHRARHSSNRRVKLSQVYCIKNEALPKNGIKKKLTVSSIGTVKLGADVFVNLKQGNIHKYYTKGEVLG